MRALSGARFLPFLMRPFPLRKVLPVCAVIALGIYYWKFTHVSLRTSFSDDDLMNLFFAWREPWAEILKANVFARTSVIRPFGTLFYSVFFEFFGFNGLPFRVLCYSVLWLNVLLTYLFVRRLTGSRETGFYAVFFHCYQANYFPMYFGSGHCYDIFAFFFYFSAFLAVVRVRQADRFLNARECVIAGGLFALAVNSKEAAASLPVMLLIYELLHGVPRRLAWLWREGRAALVTGCIGMLFLWARFTGPNNLLDNPAYAPVFTIDQYLLSVANYLNELTSRGSFWTVPLAVLVLGTMAVTAAVTRSRVLWFSFALVAVGAAPIAFVSPRGIAAYYIPIVGYAVFAATVLVRLREFAVRTRSPLSVQISQAVLFCLIFAVNWKYQMRHQRRFPEYWRNLQNIDAAAAEFRPRDDWFRPGSLVLIVNDPFPENRWASSFIALLVRNDHSIVVHRLGMSEPAITQADLPRYARIIGYENGRYVELPDFRIPSNAGEPAQGALQLR